MLDRRAGLAVAAVLLGGCGEKFTTTDVPADAAAGGAAGAGGQPGGSGPGGAGGSGGCPAGQADCDADGSCETDTTSSAADCGACGHSCLEGDCEDSRCQPFAFATPDDIMAKGNGFLTLDGANVYFGYEAPTHGGVLRVSKSDGSGGPLDPAAVSPGELVVGGSSLFWTDRLASPPGVRYVALVGGSVTNRWQGTAGRPIAANAVSVFWHDAENGGVMGDYFGGGHWAVLEASQPTVSSLAADDDSLYWTTETAILAEDLANAAEDAVTRLSGRENPRSLLLVGPTLFWAEGGWAQDDNAIYRMSQTGSTPTAIVAPGSWRAHAIAVDGDHVYVADNSGGQIWRVAIAGGSPELLASDQPDPLDIAVDQDRIYWTSETTAPLYALAK